MKFDVKCDYNIRYTIIHCNPGPLFREIIIIILPRLLFLQAPLSNASAVMF